MAKFKKGESGNPGGRPKGTPNRLTADLRRALTEPFDPAAFAEWVKDNLGAYYTQIVTKLIPKDVNLRVIQDWDDLSDEEKIAVAQSLKAKYAQMKKDA